jgi:hypothetical protein
LFLLCGTEGGIAQHVLCRITRRVGVNEFFFFFI